jgi:hypothetical protein
MKILFIFLFVLSCSSGDRKEGPENKYQEDLAEFKHKVLRSSDTKECNVDSECMKEGECSFGKCRNDGRRACIFAKDCEVRGRCEEVSESSSHGPPMRIKVCDYGRW